MQRIGVQRSSYGSPGVVRIRSRPEVYQRFMQHESYAKQTGYHSPHWPETGHMIQLYKKPQISYAAVQHMESVGCRQRNAVDLFYDYTLLLAESIPAELMHSFFTALQGF